jgi:hypothetical protein
MTLSVREKVRRDYHRVSLIISCLVATVQAIFIPRRMRSLVLLAKEVLDLVTQAFLFVLLLLVLFLGGSTVASILLFVDVSFTSALDSQLAKAGSKCVLGKLTPVWKLS